MKPDIETLINTVLLDNTTGEITPHALREVLHNMAAVMQNDHVALRGGGFLNTSSGKVSHYTTAAVTPFADAGVSPSNGEISFTGNYPRVVVDGHIYFEVTGAESFKLCCAVDGVVDTEYFAMLSSQNNNTHFRKVLEGVKDGQEVSFYILPISPTTPYSAMSLIKIDMDVYPIRVGVNS